MYPSRFAVALVGCADSFGCDPDDLRDLQGSADEVAVPAVAARAERFLSTDPGSSAATVCSGHKR
jgi:hypothetical protein